MSLRAVLLVCLLSLSCAGESMKVKKGEPQTAREKMLAEQKANPDKDDAPPTSKQWTGWRYQGDRKDCFFVVGRKCYKTEKAACQAAKCKKPLECTSDDGAPAKMTCAK
jgi:hypothetical protein